MNGEQIAQALGNVKRVSDGWRCRCPLSSEHNNQDRNPSLHVDDSKELVHCLTKHRDQQDRVVNALKAQGLWFSRNGTGAKASSSSKDDEHLRNWDLVTPISPAVLAHAPSSDSLAEFLGKQLNVKDAIRYDYRNAAGELLYCVFRFETADGKQIRPGTLWRKRDSTGRLWWHSKWPDILSLYRLEQLTQRPGMPVLLVEGEKKADAAAKLLQGQYLVLALPGGAKAVKKTDLTPLANRTVFLWPDNDEDGFCAMIEAARAIEFRQAPITNIVRILKPDDAWPLGYDVDDLITKHGWDGAQLVKFIEGPPVRGLVVDLFEEDRWKRFPDRKSGNSKLTIERAREYLKLHDEEASPENEATAGIVFSPEYIAAVVALYDQAPFEYRRLVIELKRRGYHAPDFERKVREARTEQKRQRSGKGQRTTQQSSGTATAAAPAPNAWRAKLLAASCPFVVKGSTVSYRGRLYCYVVRRTNSLVALPPTQHRAPELFQLAPIDWWLAQYPYQTEKGRVLVDWATAQSDMFTAAAAAGVFDPAQSRRGVGLWNDNGKLVFHKGDSLIGEDASLIALASFKSDYVYEPRAKVTININDCASDEEVEQLTAALECFYWKNKVSPKLLAGCVATAPLAGALEFRPTVWVVGGDQAGKSTLLKETLIPSLGGDPGHLLIVPSGSQTTEAFLRQSVDSDSKTIIFDEADKPDDAGKRNSMGAILNYVRGSNSPGGVGKGGADGQPVHYSGKPMVIIASISLPLTESADIGRTIVFELARPTQTAETAQTFTKLKEIIRSHLTLAFGRRFIARCVRHARVTITNIATYREALIRAGQDSRTADKLSTALAGAYSLTSLAAEPISARDAAEDIENISFGNFINVDGGQHAEGRDERACWDYLTAQRIRIDKTDHTFGELIETGYERNLSKDQCDALERNGMKFTVPKQGKPSLHIAQKKKVVAMLLKDTKWADNYHLHFNRLLEAEGLDPADYVTQLRFAGLGRPRATTFPPTLLDSLLGLKP